MKFLETEYKLGIKEVDFKPFLKNMSLDIKKYVNMHITFFKDGKSMPYKTTERILEFYSNEENRSKVSAKEIEYFKSKISNNENLFLIFYERVKTELKSFSFKEKISIATICFSESMWEQGLSNLEQFRLHELFYNDYIEWQKLENHLSLEKETGGFDELFTSRAEYNKFVKVLKKNNWIDTNNKVNVKSKKIIASILKLLKKDKILQDVSATEISKRFEKTFNVKVWKSYFSEVDTDDIEKSDLYKDLLMEFNIGNEVQ